MRIGRVVDLGFNGVVLGVGYRGRVDVKVDGSVRTRESSSWWKLMMTGAPEHGGRGWWCSGESFTWNGRSC